MAENEREKKKYIEMKNKKKKPYEISSEWDIC